MAVCRKLVPHNSTKVETKPTSFHAHFEAASQAKTAVANKTSVESFDAQNVISKASCIDDDDNISHSEEDGADEEDSDDDEFDETDITELIGRQSNQLPTIGLRILCAGTVQSQPKSSTFKS